MHPIDLSFDLFSVQLLKDLPESYMLKIADVIEEVSAHILMEPFDYFWGGWVG